jgi:hypothetical protein
MAESSSGHNGSVDCRFTALWCRDRLTHDSVLRKRRDIRARCSGLHQNRCVNDARRPVLHRFFGKQGHGGKNRLPSASGMTKIAQRWGDDHRQTRIPGRR